MQQLPDLNNLRIFLKVVETKNYTEAARFLQVTKSRVSRAVSALEKELNANLVYRTTRQVVPTSAGEKLYSNCWASMEGILDGVKNNISSGGLVEGVVTLTSVEDLGIHFLAPIVAKFCELYSNVAVKMYFEDSITHLIENSIDVALRVGKIKQQSLRFRRVGTTSFILVASPKYLKKFNSKPEIDSVSQYDFIVYLGFYAKNASLMLYKNEQKRSIQVHQKIVCSNTQAILQMALHGAGIALLPDFLSAAALNEGMLVPVCKGWHTETKDIQIVTPIAHKTNSAAKHFSNFLFESLKAKFSVFP